MGIFRGRRVVKAIQRFSKEVLHNRKAARTNRMVAHAALAHKLARASYYIMRDGVAFDEKKLFV